MIICVVGPTGVGKTKMSVELAKRFNAIIVNADSMQIYKDLNIGTAKVTEEEKEGIPHFLFDIKKPAEMYTIYDYQKDLRKIINEHKDQNIILVGGSGLYVKAGLFNYELEEETQNETFDEYSNEELFKMVKELDPDLDVHENNRKRLVRRLNRKENTGKKDELLYPAIFIGLTCNRDILYERINKRVDKMVDDGLIEEVKALYDKKIRSKAILTGIGYKELYEYFDGNITKEEALDLIKSRSRKYAKRQYTWFKNQMDVKWLNVDFDNFNNTVLEAVKYIESAK